MWPQLGVGFTCAAGGPLYISGPSQLLYISGTPPTRRPCGLPTALMPVRSRVQRVPRHELGHSIVRIPADGRSVVRERQAREIVESFFQDVSRINAQGNPMRFQVASTALTILIYGMIVRRVLQSRPNGRCAIFVPRIADARRICRELRLLQLQTHLVGDGSSRSDPFAAVVVCVSASARHLAGQHFAVKLVDSAELRRDGLARNLITSHVKASMSAEFSLHFDSNEADCAYPLSEALRDGRVRSLEPYLLLADRTPCLGSQLLKTLSAIQVDAAWAPVLVVLNKPRDAQALANELQGLGVAAAAAVSRRLRGQQVLQDVREGHVKVLCVSHWRFERSDLPSFSTIVLAESLSVKPSWREAIIRALQPGNTDFGALKLVCMITTPKPELQLTRVQQASRIVGALSGTGKPPDSWQVLHADGSTGAWTPRPREWLESLCNWVQKHGRKPHWSSKREKTMFGRWRQACKYMRRDCLNVAEVELMERTCSILAESPQRCPRDVLQDLCDWICTHGRHPYQLSRDPVERRQSCRLSRALARFEKGRLSSEHAQLLENALQFTVRPWLASMVAWIRFFERLPYLYATEPDERTQNRRWKKANELLSKCRLTTAEMELMWNCQNWRHELSERPRACLVALRAWIHVHRRQPHFGMASSAEELLQAGRWKRATRQLSEGDLTEGEVSLMEDCQRIVSSSKPREWLEGLCKWVQKHGRRPHWCDRHKKTMLSRWKTACMYMRRGNLNVAEIELMERMRNILAEDLQQSPKDVAQEKPQASRWKRGTRQLSEGDPTGGEVSLMEDCQRIVSSSKPREWLESLCKWVQKHGRRPHWCDRHEKTMLSRWKAACMHMRRDSLNVAEIELMERMCNILAENLQQSPKDIVQDQLAQEPGKCCLRD